MLCACSLRTTWPPASGACARLRARRALHDVRLIVLSGLHASVMEEPAVNHGADRYVEKGEPLPTLRCAVLELADACE